MNKPITKRAQEARMRVNGVTPLKQTGKKDEFTPDAVAGAIPDDSDKALVGGGDDKETKKEPQGTSADNANQVAQGNKSMVTQPRPYTFEASATPKQKARQEVGAQKIKQRGADKLDKIADKQNRKRAGKELKGLKREATDKKRLDGLTFKERREVGQAFRRGDYKSVLGGEDAKRATQLRGTKKGYTPDDEKPSTPSKPKIELTKIEEAPKNKNVTKEKGSDQTKTIKPATRREINASKRDDIRRARKADKENKKAEKASNKIDRDRNKLNERMAVLEGNEAGSTKRAKRYVKRKGREGLRKEEKAAKQEARDQKKLDKAMDQVVKLGVKGSEKLAKQFDREENSRKNRKEENKQAKENFANDPTSARFAGKSPEKVKKMIRKDIDKRYKAAKKSEKLRKRGKLGPNESLVSKRDQRNRANYETAVEMSKGSTPVNLPKKEIPKVSSPMKMMGINSGANSMKKGYFKNK